MIPRLRPSGRRAAGGLIARTLLGAVALAAGTVARPGGHEGVWVAPGPHRAVSHVAGDEQPIPLNDLGKGKYLGFTGGLYLNGTNELPAAHRKEGRERAQAIRPLGKQGKPWAGGKVVMLSIGMSNTNQEFCGQPTPPCEPGSFMRRAAQLDALSDSLVLVNGAIGGTPAGQWDSADDPAYDEVREERLGPMGVTETQVQVVWLKQANMSPKLSLPDPDADAYRLEATLGDIVRALDQRYPNLQQVFISSRIYAGYATIGLNPEPYAYESGFAVKWLIRAQIKQMKPGGEVDDVAGDLDYDTVAPWIGWAAYLWADGTIERSDGLIWEQEDFRDDGTHPSTSGVKKVGKLLIDFFEADKTTRPWLLQD